MREKFDSKAGIILVKTKVYGPAGDGIVNLALDTGATWTLVRWEIAVQLGYDPASVRERTPVTTGSGSRDVPEEDGTESWQSSCSDLETARSRDVPDEEGTERSDACCHVKPA